MLDLIPKSWDAVHPLIVHFPVALLLVAPLFIVIALILPRQALPYAISALVLLVIGTIAAYIAVSTGKAAAELADLDDQNKSLMAAIDQHQELAERTRLIFTVLTVLFAAIMTGPVLLKKSLKRVTTVMIYGVFLVAYLFGCYTLAGAAHMGGRLVHIFGVRAMIEPGADQPAPTNSAETKNTPAMDDKAE